MRLDFIGVGFGRTGSTWLTNCLNEHPEISIPEFNLLTEINYFPGEYEAMGLKNYIKKFKNCDFEKVVGELSTLIILEKRSSALLKKLFPDVKVVIYRRNESDRAKSARNVAENYDLVNDTSVSMNPIDEINQEEYIRPFIKEFGKKVHIFDMDNPDKGGELNRLFKFLSVSKFVPVNLESRPNQSYSDKGRKKVLKTKYPAFRKVINLAKSKLKANKKLFYFMKRSLRFDSYFQMLNHNI